MSPHTSLPKKKVISWLLNISIGVMLVVVFASVLKKDSPDDDTGPSIAPSAKIAIKGVDLKKSPRTLLLAVAKDCEYCTDSARFYRRLIQGLAGRSNIRVVAIFPDSLAVGRGYLNQLDLAVGESAQASLPSLGIKNVPALVLLNQDGLVSNVWIGKLAPKTETEVMESLALEDTRPTSDWTIDERDLQRRLDNHEEIVLLDLRQRGAYAQGHLPSAKNIPYDELNTRAGNELSQNAIIVLYSDDDSITDIAYTILSRHNFPHVLVLNRNSPTS